ncbi:MAG: chorismate mutase [Firmicutes bacterium]|nr:chorismate mutase [Bacillota bacterium]
MADKQCRGIRGAITVEENTDHCIKSATRELLVNLVEENQITPEDIVSIIFTVTKDLNAAFPAAAARDLGWRHVPLLCCTEIDVPGAMARCVRVLLHVNTTRTQEEIKHVYLKDAVRLRQDLFE